MIDIDPFKHNAPSILERLIGTSRNKEKNCAVCSINIYADRDK